MLKYICEDISNKIYEKQFEEEIKSPYFLQRFEFYKNEKDKLKVYCSYLLLKKLAKSCFDINIDYDEILRDEFGKPYDKSNKFYFNISHSGNFVVVCISDCEVGVDIQELSKYNPKIAKRYFTKKQNLFLKILPKKDLLFTKYWTMLEAKIKYFKSIINVPKDCSFKKHNLHLLTKKLTDKQNKKYYLSILSEEKAKLNYNSFN